MLQRRPESEQNLWGKIWEKMVQSTKLIKGNPESLVREGGGKSGGNNGAQVGGQVSSIAVDKWTQSKNRWKGKPVDSLR